MQKKELISHIAMIVGGVICIILCAIWSGDFWGLLMTGVLGFLLGVYTLSFVSTYIVDSEDSNIIESPGNLCNNPTCESYSKDYADRDEIFCDDCIRRKGVGDNFHEYKPISDEKTLDAIEKEQAEVNKNAQ